MGLINGRPLQPKPAHSIASCVIIRFKADAAIPAAGSSAKARVSDDWQGLARRYPSLKFTPYITSARDSAERSGQAVRRPSAAALRLKRYFSVEVPTGISAQDLARELQSATDVDTAYVDPGPAPPPVIAFDDPRSINQGYLDAAPDGINARWAWSRVDGSGVGFVDLEQGWTLDHEDLAAAGIALISGINKAWHGHGTAVLGEVASVDNTRGCVGIAPRASTRVVSEWRTASSYNTADAIASAASVMSAGDVLLLEAQTLYPGVPTYVPVEVYDATFDAIRAAVDDGIIVVQAAGNGAVNLDTFETATGQRILNRASADFRDSGAIMVGAAVSALPHPRSGFSNFGTRIDCYGWGDSIETCGDGLSGTGATTYTSSFGGTSGASPIVSGAALILQSWADSRSIPRFTPAAMRSILSDPTLNTASQNPSVDRIGVMPNLRALIESQERPALAGRYDRFAIVARILFGITNDAGGVIWLPGKGPVPVGPWGTQMENVTPGVRDTLAALAVFELSGLVADETTQNSIRTAAVNAIKNSAERLMLK